MEILPFPNHTDLLEEPDVPTYDRMVTPFQDEAELTSSFSTLVENEATVRKSSLYHSSSTSSVPSPRPRRGSTSRIPGENAASSSLPRTNNTEPRSCLPPSFVENRIGATIVYELSVLLVHGRFKRDNNLYSGTPHQQRT